MPLWLHLVAAWQGPAGDIRNGTGLPGVLRRPKGAQGDCNRGRAGTSPGQAPPLRGHQDVDGLFAGCVGALLDLLRRTATQRVVQNDERVVRYAHHPGNVAGRDLERGGA